MDALRHRTPTGRRMRRSTAGSAQAIREFPRGVARILKAGYPSARAMRNQEGPRTAMRSVCIATYNGEKFIGRQIESILEQLSPDDEVIIVDDCSRDRTTDVISGFNDARIRIFPNDRNHREVYSFGRALELCKGDTVFLADQDDIWLPGRVKMMEDALARSGALLVTTNFCSIDEEDRRIPLSFYGVRSEGSRRYLRNIADIFAGRMNYFGCAMAMRRELIPVIVPIPDYVESHDLWIALAANLFRSNVHLNEATLLKRRHQTNVSGLVSNRSLYMKLRARLIFLQSLADLSRRRGKLAIPGSASATAQ
jgi:glycosyltransferase involved in cell wall biosynthesis